MAVFRTVGTASGDLVANRTLLPDATGTMRVVSQSRLFERPGPSSPISEPGSSFIGPESFHRTPEIGIFTPERAGLANGAIR